MNEMLTLGQMLAVDARVLGDATGARDLDRAVRFRQWTERSCRLGDTPALVDVITSQTVVSSDARKDLSFVPDYQALTAWDDAERKRREG